MYIRQKIESTGIWPGVGWLGDLAESPSEAEARRLKDEMKKLALRVEAASSGVSTVPFWKGVERLYQQWSELKAEADWEVYQIAATAAERLGCGTVRYLRMMKALASGNLTPVAAKSITAEKDWLENHFAHVDIHLRRNAKGDLQAEGQLLGAQAVNAFQRAQKELKEKGKFDDLLPAIPYTIDGQAVRLGPGFAISSGVSVVNIDQKGDSSFQLQSKPGRFNYLRTRDECPL
jgi:hypothetical protein